MTAEHVLGPLFKPEVRNAGENLVAKDSVVVKQATDKQVEGYVKSGTSFAKVSFWSGSIAAESFTVDCSCSYAQKGRLCRHVWALLLKASEQFPDFFENKRALEKGSRAEATASGSKKTEKPKYVSPKAAEYKQRQADSRKQAYQVQKARAKALKQESRSGSKSSSKTPVSEKVAAALKYFEANGFPIELPADAEQIQSAKRILSRVFHPDKGGTNDEMLELLRHSKVLLDS